MVGRSVGRSTVVLRGFVDEENAEVEEDHGDGEEVECHEFPVWNVVGYSN